MNNGLLDGKLEIQHRLTPETMIFISAVLIFLAITKKK